MPRPEIPSDVLVVRIYDLDLCTMTPLITSEEEEISGQLSLSTLKKFFSATATYIFIFQCNHGHFNISFCFRVTVHNGVKVHSFAPAISVKIGR